MDFSKLVSGLPGLQFQQVQAAMQQGAKVAAQAAAQVTSAAPKLDVFNLDKLMEDEKNKGQANSGNVLVESLQTKQAGQGAAISMSALRPSAPSASVQQLADDALLADLESAGITGLATSSETCGSTTPRRAEISATHEPRRVPSSAGLAGMSASRSSADLFGAGSRAASRRGSGVNIPPLPLAALTAAHEAANAFTLSAPVPQPASVFPSMALPAGLSADAAAASLGSFFSKAAATMTAGANTMAAGATSAVSAIGTLPAALPSMQANLPTLPLTAFNQVSLPGAGHLKRISAVFASPSHRASAGSGGDGGGSEGTPSKGILKFSHSGVGMNPALLAGGGGGEARASGVSGAGVGGALHSTCSRCERYLECVLLPVLLLIKVGGPILSLLFGCLGMKACVIGFKRATSRLSDRQLALIILALIVLWFAWSWGIGQLLLSASESSSATVSGDTLPQRRVPTDHAQSAVEEGGGSAS